MTSMIVGLLLSIVLPATAIFSIYVFIYKQPIWIKLLIAPAKERALLYSVINDMKKNPQDWIHDHKNHTYVNYHRGVLFRVGADRSMIFAGIDVDPQTRTIPGSPGKMWFDPKKTVTTEIRLSGETVINMLERTLKHRDKELDFFIDQFEG